VKCKSEKKVISFSITIMSCPRRLFLAILVVLFHSTLTATCFPFRRSATTARNIRSPRAGGLTSTFSGSKEAATTIGGKREKRYFTLYIKPLWAKILYCLSALNPLIAVICNDYTQMVEFLPWLQTQPKNIVVKSLTGAFSFVRFRPRVSFAIGGMLRALQLTTAFQNVIDPTVGVGFGLNMLCLFAKSRWPSTIFLGWSLTKPIWKVLGATPPSASPVPITVVFNPNKTPKPTAAGTDPSASSTSTAKTREQPALGYRIGI